MYTVYVLKSKKRNFHYIGHTNNIDNRLNEHNSGKVRSTKAYRPFELIYNEKYDTRSEAIQREKYLKFGEGNIWLRNKLLEESLW
ncbi:MAG TPA: GIY-YIG nuclease family protein [bacterium]|nr:GIY-YIG nuclease family protein [bacterium]